LQSFRDVFRMYPCSATTLALRQCLSCQTARTPEVQNVYGEPDHVCSIFAVLSFDCFGSTVPPKPNSSHAGLMEIRTGGATGQTFTPCESKPYSGFSFTHQPDHLALPHRRKARWRRNGCSLQSGGHGVKQCVYALSCDRLSCNTAGIRSFEPLVPPLKLLLPPFAASTNR
jgi:hypothetical protein